MFPTFNGSGAEIEIRISSCRKWFHEVFRFYRQVLRFLIHLSGSLCYTWAAGRRHCGGAELGIGVEKMEDGECWKVDCARDKEHLPRLKTPRAAWENIRFFARRASAPWQYALVFAGLAFAVMFGHAEFAVMIVLFLYSLPIFDIYCSTHDIKVLSFRDLFICPIA